MEGFAKLLVNKCAIPNPQICLSNLIINYISDEVSTNKAHQTNLSDNENFNDNSAMNNRIKTCLGTFFEEFIKLNRGNLNELVIKSFVPTLKYAVHQRTNSLNKKKLSDFFYYLTFNTKGIRQILILKIMDEIFKDLSEFKLVNKWVDVLLELNIHQLDIDTEQSNELANLTKIVNQLTELVVNKC